MPTKTVVADTTPAVRGPIRGRGKPRDVKLKSKLLLDYEDVASLPGLPIATPTVRGPIRGWGKPRNIELKSKLLLDYEEVASLTGIPIATLRKRVRAGTGPRVTMVGKHHRFTPKDVNAWIEELRYSSGG